LFRHLIAKQIAHAASENPNSDTSLSLNRSSSAVNLYGADLTDRRFVRSMTNAIASYLDKQPPKTVWDRVLRSLDLRDRVALMRNVLGEASRIAESDPTSGIDVDMINRLIDVGQVTAWIFDWDDNVVHMPTKVVLFEHDEVQLSNKTSNGERTGKIAEFNSEEWALVRGQFAQPGEWEKYNVLLEPKGTFRNYRDDGGDPKIFRKEIGIMLDDKSRPWQGRSWTAFELAQSDRHSAQWTYVLTARAHEQDTMYEAIEIIQKRTGKLPHLLPREHVLPINCPKLTAEYGTDPVNPSPVKKTILAEILDEVNAQPFGPASRRVLSPDEDERRYMHLFGFSDDDAKTFKETAEHLGKLVKDGKWPDTKIVLFYTGADNPRAEVIMSNGERRLARPEEHLDPIRILQRDKAHDCPAQGLSN